MVLKALQKPGGATPINYIVGVGQADWCHCEGFDKILLDYYFLIKSTDTNISCIWGVENRCGVFGTEAAVIGNGDCGS